MDLNRLFRNLPFGVHNYEATRLRYTGEFASSWFPQIVVGYAAMILIIEVVGIPLRSELTRLWAGALFALVLFLVGVLAGSATSMVVYQDFDPSSYIVKPLYWLGMYGLIPALLIGFIGAAILRSTSKKTGEHDSGLKGLQPSPALDVGQKNWLQNLPNLVNCRRDYFFCVPRDRKDLRGSEKSQATFRRPRKSQEETDPTTQCSEYQ